jgi:hypothetical protein
MAIDTWTAQFRIIQTGLAAFGLIIALMGWLGIAKPRTLGSRGYRPTKREAKIIGGGYIAFGIAFTALSLLWGNSALFSSSVLDDRKICIGAGMVSVLTIIVLRIRPSNEDEAVLEGDLEKQWRQKRVVLGDDGEYVLSSENEQRENP